MWASAESLCKPKHAQYQCSITLFGIIISQCSITLFGIIISELMSLLDGNSTEFGGILTVFVLIFTFIMLKFFSKYCHDRDSPSFNF